MDRVFVAIYDFFERRKRLFYSILAASTVLLASSASRVTFSEQITNFFPDGKDGGRHGIVFGNMKAADKIVVMFSSEDPDRSIECADAFESLLMAKAGGEYIDSVTSEVGAGEMEGAAELIYGNLPLYLSDEDYARVDSLLRPGALAARMEDNYRLLASPMGMALRDIILQDPLGMATDKFAALQELSGGVGYEIYDGHIFSPGMSFMLMIIEPSHGMGDTGVNDKLISAIEDSAQKCTREGFADVVIEYFGGPSVAVYNARQIKSDTMLTLTIALVAIIVFILLAFRNRWSVLLILTPVAFGGLFALGFIWILGYGSISAIAVGAGAAVFGVALSYSIHVISHSNHTRDPRKIISELAYPLTVGSFTTIGAFLGLLFTRSQLLRDFGLFAALTLVGTTLFCLVFLPHFLGGGKERSENRLMKAIEKINGIAYDRKKWLVALVAAVAVVCAFFSGNVKFDSDMMNLNYMPPHLKAAEEKLSSLTAGEKNTVVFASVSGGYDGAYEAYARTASMLDSLVAEGLVDGYASAGNFVASGAVRQKRIDRWNDFWSGGRKEETIAAVRESARAAGFREDAFAAFERNIEKEYFPAVYGSQEEVPAMLDAWVNVTDDIVMFIAQVDIPYGNKDEVYARFESDPDVVIVDRGYYANRMAKTVNDDFNLILLISSFLIFAALLVSYGRIELTIMAFMPMFVSWIIILGLMALLGIEFNIVNIILSTFIFGIGDDFSIFIMDGLLTEYKNGRRMLASHKTAIFFSAVTIITGLGVMIFAKHPALRSISLISILGILTVIVVSYVLQPVLFRIFITSQTRRGGFPYTLLSLLNTAYAFLVFLIGCLILQGIIASFIPLPVSAKRKKLWFHNSVNAAVRLFLGIMPTIRRKVINEFGENFSRPAVIIANHQSFIDILVLLSLHPKLVMVTNSWVWKSPFFGRIVRYSDFYHTTDGYEKLTEALRGRVREGYSVVVFPEGTRSADLKVKRFRKGAFCLAGELGLDILPVVLYGNGMVSSKGQPFYIKKGVLVAKIMKRIPPGDASFGVNYAERAKNTGSWFRAEYGRLREEYDRPCNPYFYDALIKNYTYKGPVLEWYMRIKVRLEKKYELFDRLIPRDAFIVDVGCGYGPLSYMMCLLSEKRSVLGIDYDEEKIALARHNFSHTCRMEFATADAVEYDMPDADVFVLNDVLHYMDCASQDRLLEKCLSRVRAGGMVIVRDGDSSESERHKATRRTERWSTRIVGFNKTEGELCFTSSERIAALAAKSGFVTEIRDNDRRTSNKIHIIRRA